MTSAKRTLLTGGMVMALVGMTFGLWYAIFAEHQALDGIGISLTQGFTAAANRQPADVARAMERYREAKYQYDRNVDAHSHWLGLAMVLIVLAIGFDYISYAEKWKRVLAFVLLTGSALFPLGVLLETFTHTAGPRVLAVAGSGLVMAGLVAAVAGVFRRPAPITSSTL